jgi:outer membrane protein assembly factor BamD
MSQRILIAAVLVVALFSAGCHHSKVVNPIANVDSKQPDKVLFDRAMDAMKHGKYSIARNLLETMINAYPDSEYIARAKLGLGDSWFAEGGTTALQQAEAEYKDFITFFPNLPEAAEAQLKVANIHYRQMEKPDRDFRQAMRAQDEFRSLITQFPDSKLVPEARQKLREVQEILGERQFRVARFYLGRDNLAASQARLKSLVDSYPLYSNIDQALFMLGTISEREANSMRTQKIPEAVKEKLVAQYEKEAIEAYTRIVTRYPVMERAGDARGRLAALKAPVPTATPEAIAQNQAEENSREENGRLHGLMANFKRHPDISRAPKTGEPSMEEEEQVSAATAIQQLDRELKEAMVKTLVDAQGKTGEPGANQPPPGQAPPTKAPPTPPGDSTSVPGAPGQINDVQNTAAADPKAAPAQSSPTDDKQDSSSKKKGKKGLRKLIPF